MKNINKFYILLSAILMVSITSCDNNQNSDISIIEESSSGVIETTYTITWKNYDGTILEIDTNVIKGSTPSYDGNTPTKPANNSKTYQFSGWSPEVKEVSEDTTYIALFVERNIDGNTPGVEAIFSLDNKTVQYGFYPQTHVNDSTLILTLNSLTATSINNWYEYNGEYYTKIQANVFNNETYKFDDGTTIVQNENYWFKCEPITWNVLSSDNGVYLLVSSMLLDAKSFYKDYSNRTIDEKPIYANNYENSDIRSWLNNEFYNTAFALNNSYIKEMNLNNSAETTDSVNNPYICENTNDKVSLLSYKDYLNENYGFDTNNQDASLTRICKTTDYVRSIGAWCNVKQDLDIQTLYCGSYWTRSATSQYYYCAWNVNSGGYLSSYAVDGKYNCVRPSIIISL